jgi:hypothetical protein
MDVGAGFFGRFSGLFAKMLTWARWNDIEEV